MSTRIAIIGTGISGMACAHFLYKEFDITVFEKANYIGGHTNTVYLKEGQNQIPVDTGFMVFNPINYPNLIQLFEELDVPVKETDMSFSVQHLPSSLEYNGSNLNGLFAQRRNLFNPSYLRMLLQIDRFNQCCVKDMEKEKYRSLTIAEYVEVKGFGLDMLYKYLLPMTSALWSTPTDTTMQFPAVALVRFFDNHGFLGLNTQHQWYTVDGGSEEYKKRLIAPFQHRIKQGEGVAKVMRQDGRVMLTSTKGENYEFDKVIFACHSDQVMQIFQNPYPREQELIGKIKYQKNVATLHSDTSIMPRKKSVWSSWNYRIENVNGIAQPSCIYYMNSLQDVSDEQDYFVSINDPGNINPEKIHRVIHYAHPIFTLDSMAEQKHLPDLNNEGPVYYCGAYFRYGFHEDGFTSAIDLCKKLLGASYPSLKRYRGLFEEIKKTTVW